MTTQPGENWVMAEWLAFFASGQQMINAGIELAQNRTYRNWVNLVSATAAFAASAMAPTIRIALAGQYQTLSTAVDSLQNETRFFR
jgi:hypothetical protein